VLLSRLGTYKIYIVGIRSAQQAKLPVSGSLANNVSLRMVVLITLLAEGEQEYDPLQEYAVGANIAGTEKCIIITNELCIVTPDQAIHYD